MIEIDSGVTGLMAQITIDVDEQVLERIQKQAREAGLSVEEWLRQLIDQDAPLPPGQPSDPFIGMFADKPELADAIDEVVAERYQPHAQR